MITDPTRKIVFKPMTIEDVEPEKELRWHQKMWSYLCRFIESDFFFYATIIIIRIVQISLIVLAFYFMQGGRLWFMN